MYKIHNCENVVLICRHLDRGHLNHDLGMGAKYHGPGTVQDCGLKMLDSGQWTQDSGPRTVDSGQ